MPLGNVASSGTLLSFRSVWPRPNSVERVEVLLSRSECKKRLASFTSPSPLIK
jgi:hypothetical protein